MTPPLRIALHNGAPIWGGAEVATARLAAGLRRRGHDVLLYCGREEVARRAAELGAPTAHLHLGGDIALHTAARFALALRRTGPDVLILGTFRKLWLGTLAARMAAVPRVVARIGLETDVPRNAKYRFVFGRWIDATVFNADATRRRFLDAMPGYPGDAVTIHTGISPDDPAGGRALRRELGIPEDAALIGSVGRLASQKRYDRLVRALPALAGVHVLVVGEGDERDALASLAESLGVADRFHLPGHRADVAPVLDALDIFVLCSDREGMSNAMIEALWAGVPVVSTPVSGAPEALRPLPETTAPADGTAAVEATSPAAATPRPEAPSAAADGGDVPGIVVGFDGGELTTSLRVLLDDPAGLAAMGAAARRVARERFDEDRMLDEWERVLRGAT